MRYAAIRAGLEAINLIPSTLQRGPWSGRGVIFTLHHVRPETQGGIPPVQALSVTPDFLDAALDVARRAGLVPVRLEDVPDFLDRPSADPFFAVTLDDGYRDNATFAAAVFRRHNVPYTIFATAGFAERSSVPWWEVAEALVRQSNQVMFDFGGGPATCALATERDKTAFFYRLAAFVEASDQDAAVSAFENAARDAGIDPREITAGRIMDWDALRALSSNDPLLSIGAHTLTHCNLARVNGVRLEHEIVGSADLIEQMTGHRPESFAYPYGWPNAADKREARAVEKAGFRLAVTTRAGVLKPAPDLDRFLLPRISLNGLFQQPRYVKALISGLPFLLD